MTSRILTWAFAIAIAVAIFFAADVLPSFKIQKESAILNQVPPIKNLTFPVAEVPKPKNEEDAAQKAEEAVRLQKLLTDVAKLRELLATLPAPAKEPPPSPPIKSEELYNKALKALVNIFCDDSLKRVYILGSGAVIHSAGYLLTNAHIAENFSREGVDCVLRRGAPAQNWAKAKVIYIPDQSQKISSSTIPMNDIAILKITEPLGTNTFPESFDYFDFDPVYKIQTGEVLYSLGFPTEFLGAEIILKNTNILFSLGTVEDLVTLDDNKKDAEGAYLKGEISAQHGSSGGIFLDSGRGKVVGLFVGITEGKTTAERSQFMFLTSYVDKIVKRDKGASLLEFLNTSP
ncbi:MAG: serine protease [bacterium]|nr:serine protease [bacterium]